MASFNGSSGLTSAPSAGMDSDSSDDEDENMVWEEPPKTLKTEPKVEPHPAAQASSLQEDDSDSSDDDEDDDMLWEAPPAHAAGSVQVKSEPRSQQAVKSEPYLNGATSSHMSDGTGGPDVKLHPGASLSAALPPPPPPPPPPPLPPGGLPATQPPHMRVSNGVSSHTSTPGVKSEPTIKPELGFFGPRQAAALSSSSPPSSAGVMQAHVVSSASSSHVLGGMVPPQPPPPPPAGALGGCISAVAGPRRRQRRPPRYSKRVIRKFQKEVPPRSRRPWETPPIVKNVIAHVKTGVDLNLRKLAQNCPNVEYSAQRNSSHATMRITSPVPAAVTLFSSGGLSVMGMPTETIAKIALRKCARRISRVVPDVKFLNFQATNISGSAACPFQVHLEAFSHHDDAIYEPELSGIATTLTFLMSDPKVDFTVYHTGTVQATAKSRSDFYTAMEKFYPIVAQYSKDIIRNS